MAADLHDTYFIGCLPRTSAARPTRSEPGPATMGFKAWNLLRMADMGLPVPPAFVLGTGWCHDAASRAAAAQPATWQAGLAALESRTGLRLGHGGRPLLLSVRSGAPVSMPGMMETLLNIGLCEATVPGLLRQTGHPRLVWDAYRRLVATYGEVVAGIDARHFEDATQALAGGRNERDLDFAELRDLTHRHLAVYHQHAGRAFPQDPRMQLSEAITAVLASWQSARAQAYRTSHGIADDIGTAVTVQTMVFGNAGGRSGAGVGFTRNPATGEPGLWVDFLFNAQGEDVVSGRHSAHGHALLASVLPLTWQALQEATQHLERELGDMQDFEFTVQDGTLWMLQTRSGKRTPRATARIALDLLDEGLITRAEALARVQHLTQAHLTSRRVVGEDGAPLAPLAEAVAACDGVACGEIALDEARVRARQAQGVPTVLLRVDAETSDIAALEQAEGLLTQRGARTSHAAVVARQLGKVCLVGCDALGIDLAARRVELGGQTFQEGETLTLDGHAGRIYRGVARTEADVPADLCARLVALQGDAMP